MVQQKAPQPSSAPAVSSRPPSPPSPSSSTALAAKTVGRKTMLRKPGNIASIPFWLGLLVSIMWVGVVVLIVARSGPGHTLAGLPLVDWAIGISAIASPVGLIWMVTAYLQRAADVQAVAEPLRRQLSLITGESGLAETRVRRFNQAIREQLELLKSARTTGQEDLGIIVDRIQKQRVELERFEQTSIQQVKEIQDIIRRNMQQVEHLMDDKFTMMRVLDDKLVQSGDSVARQTETLRGQTSQLLKEIEANNKHLTDALDRAVGDSKRLSDTAHIQETSLATAAANAAETLSGVSSKIDLSVARFLERAGSAREEAERLATALDTQTRALDEFSQTLPVRVGEAETVLRSVAERLHSSEKAAREQATNLSGTLAKQLDELHAFMDRFASGMTGIDDSLEKRRVDLDALAARVTNAAGNFAAEWEKSAAFLGDRADRTLARFASTNEDTRKVSETAARHLSDTVEKYEDTARRLRAMTDESTGEFKTMTEQIAVHLTQFEALRDASHKAGEEVEARASTAMQSLQFVLERLLTARDATGAVGEKLVKDLCTAVDQNESLISRLKEAAQAGAAALGTAAEQIGKQQDGIISQTRGARQVLQDAVVEIQKKAASAVADLRGQTGSLTSLLAEAQIQMETTDRKMQSFIASSMPPIHEAIKQIDTATVTGMQSALRYGEELQAKLKSLSADSVAPIADAVKQIDAATAAGLNAATRYGSDLRAKLELLAADSLAPITEAIREIDTATASGLQSIARYGTQLQDKVKAFANDSLTPAIEAVKKAESVADAGIQSMGRYGTGIEEQLGRLQGFNARIGSMGEELSHITLTTVSSIEQMQGRFADARKAQEDTARQTLAQFTDIADRISREVGGLDGQALKAITSLQDAAARVGEQSYQMLQNAETSSAKMQIVTSALQKEAVQINAVLQKQAEDFTINLTRAEKQFAALGDALQQRTDAAYSLLDRVAVHYNETTRAAAQELDTRATRLEETALSAQGKVEGLSAAIGQQLSVLGSGSAQIEAQAEKIASTGARALQQLSAVNEKLVIATEAANTNTQTTIAKLENCGTAFLRQSNDLAAAAQNSIAFVEKAGAAFGDQAIKTSDANRAIEQSVRQLTSSVTALAEQSAQIRAGMEQQSARLLMQLAEAVSQLDSNGAKLQQASSHAIAAAEQAGARFGDVTTTTRQNLTATHEQMQDIAGKAETALTALGSNITQQASAMAALSEQLAEQQRVLTAASDSQRTQMIELFDKLGAAHGQASLVAERTIAHLTEALDQVQRQLGALSDQSQVTVGNIRAAGTGFAEQASSLLQNAQAAEAQARTVLSVTGALQDQARQLRESLVSESDRANESMTGLLDKLTAGGAQLRDLTTGTAAALAGLNTGVTQQTQTIASTMEHITERQRALTVSLDAQRDVMNALLGRLAEAQEETSTLAERTNTRLTEGAQQLAKQAETIDAGARAALTSMQAATQGFTQESTAITTHAQEAEQQVRGILSATVSLQDEARRMRETLDAEGARTSSILTDLFAKLSQGSDQVRALSGSAEAALGSIGGNITQQTESLSSAMYQINERQRDLSHALESQREVLSGLLKRFSDAQEDSAVMAERTATRIVDSTQIMTGRIEAIEGQSKAALSTLDAANNGFAQQAEALMSRAQQAEQQMRSALAATVALQDQTKQMREALDSEGLRTSEILTGLLDRLMKGSEQVREAGSTAETVIGGIGGTVAEKANILAAAMQQINERQKILGTALDSQRDNLNDLLNRLVLAQDETASVAERTATRLADSARLVTTQIESIDTQSRSAIASLEAANNGFGQEAAALSGHARDAEQQARAMLAVTSTLQDQARQIRETLTGESDRTTSALADLLGRLTAGGATLETLSGGINRQSGEIGAVMQDVIARQKALTEAMAEQREAVGTLLDRIVEAQGQATSVSERTAAQLANCTDAITKQLEVMGAQAETTLTSVQTASKGFAGEAEILSSHAQQAEQQVRGILASMSGLGEQGHVLSESIRSETGRVIAEIGSVIAQLDAANNSTARVAKASELIAAQFRLVDEAGTQAETHTRRLAATADEAVGRLGVLRQTIDESEREGQNAFTQVAVRIETVKAALQGELQRLADASQTAVQDVTAAATQLTAQSDIMRANLAASESALTNAAMLVRDESVQLPATLERSATQIETAASRLKAQATETDQTLVGTADRFIAVTALARESMVDEIRHVSSVAEEADKIMRQFASTLGQQVMAMQQGAASLSNEQRELVEKSGASVLQIAAASNRLAQLRTDAAATAEKLAREFDALDVRVSATGQRLEKASAAATETMSNLSEVTQRAEEQIQGATSGFRDQLERIRGGLQTQVDDLNRGLMQITAQLERTGSTLRSTTAGTVADVERISQRFDDTSKETAAQLAEKTARMRTATEEVAKLLSGFGDQLDVLLDRLAMAGDGIKRQEGGVVEQMQTALAHLTGISERLEASRHLAADVSEQTVARLGEVVKAVEEQMQGLTNGSQAAAGIMRGIGQIYGNQTQALNHSVGEAHAEVQAMNKAVDEMQQRTDRIRLSLKLQSDELMQGLSQILRQLTTTGDALSDTVDHVLQERAVDSLKKIG